MIVSLLKYTQSPPVLPSQDRGKNLLNHSAHGINIGFQVLRIETIRLFRVGECDFQFHLFTLA